MTREYSERGLAIRKEVLGEEHVERSLAAATAFTDEFQKLITRYAWEEIWGRPTLPRRVRSMLVLAMMIALNRPDEFRLHVRAAFRNGLTAGDIREVVLQAAIYCGVPAANSAMHWAAEEFRALGIDPDAPGQEARQDATHEGATP